MKRVAVTMRQSSEALQPAGRDHLERCWYDFIKRCGFLPILLPNDEGLAMSLLSELNVEAVILTGGGNAFSISGEFTERDAVELALYEWAIRNKIPVLGVCRGAQVLLSFRGISCQRVENHVGRTHDVSIDGEVRVVNSFHDFGTFETLGFDRYGVAEDGVVEYFEYKNCRVMGIMWHPERNLPFLQGDINLFVRHFG